MVEGDGQFLVVDAQSCFFSYSFFFLTITGDGERVMVDIGFLVV